MSSKSTKSWQNSKKIDQKWYKNKNAVTGSNQWKFDNKIVKSQPNISLISKPENQWKVIIKSNQNQWNLRKYWPKFNPILWSNSEKINENQIKSCTTPYSILRENHWKLIINSWKINENQWNLWPFLRENHWKLTIIWPKIDPKSWQSDTKILML